MASRWGVGRNCTNRVWLCMASFASSGWSASINYGGGPIWAKLDIFSEMASSHSNPRNARDHSYDYLIGENEKKCSPGGPEDLTRAW
jgi:hypothetical protein